MLRPTLPREPGSFRVDADPPDPLPTTGPPVPGVASGPAAQPAEAWSSARPGPPRRPLPPVTLPWVEAPAAARPAEPEVAAQAFAIEEALHPSETGKARSVRSTPHWIWSAWPSSMSNASQTGTR